MKTLRIAALAALLGTTAAFAHDYTVGSITIAHPMAFETAKSASVGGGYMTLTNSGDTPDTLRDIRSDTVPMIQLHKSETDANGVARMFHLEDGIPLPAGETVTLEPGGLHVMFMGLDGDPLEDGEEVKATLVFENAGEVDVIFNVEPRRGGMDHSNHSKSD
ncbi:copper chaperone PCu(A)C [uncultured Sulfitobacter sp.]|uniref:copper chaperone PCu(A)C n=1 Tax=uncultured Sulfitobacter sp. TaxID=191468 RepID=UPI0026211759|nr:copper chaperone PCu(A)C [uncultured Sulfitobacter sp.]